MTCENVELQPDLSALPDAFPDVDVVGTFFFFGGGGITIEIGLCGWAFLAPPPRRQRTDPNLIFC